MAIVKLNSHESDGESGGKIGFVWEKKISSYMIEALLWANSFCGTFVFSQILPFQRLPE